MCVVHFEKPMPVKVIGGKDFSTFGHKSETIEGRRRQSVHTRIVGELITHKHFRLLPVVVQGFHEPVRRNGSTAGVFGGIYK